MLSDNIYDYWWVSQGKVTVDSIDDKEDMGFADEAYDILGFTNQEKYNIYKLTPVVMHMGNFTKDFVQWVKRSRLKSRMKLMLRSLLISVASI